MKIFIMSATCLLMSLFLVSSLNAGSVNVHQYGLLQKGMSEGQVSGRIRQEPDKKSIKIIELPYRRTINRYDKKRNRSLRGGIGSRQVVITRWYFKGSRVSHPVELTFHNGELIEKRKLRP